MYAAVKQASTGDATQRSRTHSPLLRLPAEIRNIIYTHVFSAAYVHPVRNPSGSISRYIVIEEGTPTLLTCRQVHLDAIWYKHAHTTLTFPDCLYFPELVFIIQKSNSNAVRTLNLTLGMVSNLRTLMMADGGNRVPASWPDRETVRKAFPALECIRITTALTEMDRIQNLRCIEKATQDVDGVVRALRTVFRKLDLQVESDV